MPLTGTAQQNYNRHMTTDEALLNYCAADVNATIRVSESMDRLQLVMRAYTALYALDSFASTSQDAGVRSQMPTLTAAEAQHIINIVTDVLAGQRTTLLDCLIAHRLTSAVFDFVVDGKFA